MVARSKSDAGEAAGSRWSVRREEAALQRITIHEARHTCASFLMAAGYDLKQIQEYLGHADLATTARYIQNLPVPTGTTERAKLGTYLEGLPRADYRDRQAIAGRVESNG